MPVTAEKVSVIVPIYNVERFLPQCLESIRSQTYSNLEIICVNDGSTDGSLRTIRDFADRDPRFVVIDKQNEGYGAGCNQGIARATGDWISIVEPDDWIEPTMYEDMLSFASTFGEVDIVKTPWTDITNWDNPANEGRRRCPFKGNISTTKKAFRVSNEPILLECHPSIWSAIYRRDFLLEHQIRFMEIPGAGWADNPFLIETMCQAKKIVYLDKTFYNYRCDLPGSTRNHTSDVAIARPFDRWDDMLAVLRRLKVEDPSILCAHYIRGFNYVFGAIADDGWGNPIVKERTAKMFRAMDAGLVAHIQEISPARKEFFFSVRGENCPKISTLPWLKHLVKETGVTLRYDGLGSVLKRGIKLLSR